MNTDKSKRPGAPVGNRNAKKPEEQKRTSRIYVNVTPREKATCIKKAGGKINPWARKKLGLDK